MNSLVNSAKLAIHSNDWVFGVTALTVNCISYRISCKKRKVKRHQRNFNYSKKPFSVTLNDVAVLQIILLIRF